MAEDTATETEEDTVEDTTAETEEIAEETTAETEEGTGEETATETEEGVAEKITTETEEGLAEETASEHAESLADVETDDDEESYKAVPGRHGDIKPEVDPYHAIPNSERGSDQVPISDTVEKSEKEGITTETTDKTSFEKLSEYMSEHNYGPDDFATYSQDPVWRTLHREVYPDYEMPELSQENARTQLSEYMNEHNYGVDDYETYSKDPVWQELHGAAYPDYEMPAENNDVVAEFVSGKEMLEQFGTEKYRYGSDYPDSYKMCLVTHVIVAGLYAVSLLSNLIANEHTADSIEQHEMELKYDKESSSKLKSILDRTSDRKMKKLVEKAYDTVHSSPVKSNSSVMDIELDVMELIETLNNMINNADEERVKSLINKIINQAEERNRRLKYRS